jgi:glycopeptide antibiotics resistance protein
MLCKTLFGIGLIIVVGVILFTTVSSRPSGETFDHSLIPFHSYREVLNGGNIEILRSNFMNVVLFYPAGLLFGSLLPHGWRKWHKVLLTVVVFCALSCGIEYMQYAFSLGHVEIDDVIHNAFGALLGGIFCFIPLEPWRWFQIVHPSE